MSKLEENATKLVQILAKAGYTAFFAGGYVRDKIMKRKVSDIDIATNAKPNEIKKVLAKNKIKYIEIGEQFGVIAAVVKQAKKGNQIFEIATFREDFGSEDSRHPSKVKLNVSPEQDAKRRDFTINGLFAEVDSISYKLQAKTSKEYKWGRVTDFVGGIEDIKNKLIRFIGNPNKRIAEDALRMIRAIRFSAQLGFEIEEVSFKAISKNKNLVGKISAERIRDEMNKILVSSSPRKGIELLDEVGILEIILPELIKGKETPQPINMHLEGDVFKHTLLSLDVMRKKNDSVFAWSVLLHDIGKPVTIQTPEKDGTDRIRFSGHDSQGAEIAGQIMRRLKFSNDKIDKVKWLIKFHMVFSNLFKMREARRVRYLANPYFPDLLELFWVDANSSVRSDKKGNPLPPELSAYNRAKKILEKEKNKPKLPKRIINGNDIMKIMGIKQGNKKVGEVIESVYDLQLEKKFKTKKEGLKIVEKLLKKG